MQLDVARILAEKIGRDIGMDVGRDRCRRPERLAGAGEPCIGMDAQPEQEWELGEFDGFERRHLHVHPPSRNVSRYGTGITRKANIIDERRQLAHRSFMEPCS